MIIVRRSPSSGSRGTEQSEEVGKIDDAFGFEPLVVRERWTPRCIRIDKAMAIAWSEYMAGQGRPADEVLRDLRSKRK